MSLLSTIPTRLGINRAVALALSTRVIQGAAGLVTLLVIATWYTPQLQGYYFTFASLLALQTFVELGLGIITTNFASHEWVRLRLADDGSIAGEQAAHERLAGLARFVALWFAAASAIFVIAAGSYGLRFLDEGNAAVSWRAPWLSAVALAGGVLWLTPWLALLEGCQQVVPVLRIRLVQKLASIAVLWLAICTGMGLWAVPLSLAASLAVMIAALALRHAAFFASLLPSRVVGALNWRHEVWPMQWRLAVQGVVNYFMYFLFTPVLFHYHGPIAAGQMGMTIEFVTAIQLMALVWLQVRVPRFAAQAAKGEYAQLDTEWKRAMLMSTLFVAAAGLTFWIALCGLNGINHPLANRILAPLPAALLMASFLVSHLIQCHAIYLRAHKREVMTAIGVSSGILTGLAVWVWGRDYGAIGAASANLAVLALFTLPATVRIWSLSRQRWHRGPIEDR